MIERLRRATRSEDLFYVMLVFAPRQVAEREGSPGTWALRFLLFVVSLTVGQTWLGLVRG